MNEMDCLCEIFVWKRGILCVSSQKQPVITHHNITSSPCSQPGLTTSLLYNTTAKWLPAVIWSPTCRVQGGSVTRCLWWSLLNYLSLSQTCGTQTGCVAHSPHLSLCTRPSQLGIQFQLSQLWLTHTGWHRGSSLLTIFNDTTQMSLMPHHICLERSCT